MFPYAYRERSLRQAVVTHSGDLPEKTVKEFLREPKAYFLKFDREGRFQDESEEVRRRYRHLAGPEGEPSPRGPP
jgi:hypothetical protein